MRRHIFTLCLILLTLLAAASGSSRRAPRSETDLRAPFSLELPEIGGLTITDLDARIPTSNLHVLKLRVHKPFAETINAGNIYTKVNGESAGAIQTKGRDSNDNIVLTLDLDARPRFKLKPDKNVIEIEATDRNHRSYYASYVLLTGESRDGDSEMGGVTLTKVPVATGPDRQPPEIYLTSPHHGTRGLRPARVLTVSGVVTDDSGQVASVTINRQPVALSPASGPRALLPGTPNASTAAFAFERAVTIESGASPLVIEARDRAGNLARLTIRRVSGSGSAPVEGKFTGRKFAVIVGLSRYQDVNIPRLNFADADARALNEFLQRPEGGKFEPNNVKCLENEEATIDNVNAALDRYLAQADQNDLLLFYIAGHGGPDPYAPQNLYYVMYDTRTFDLQRTALRMTDLQAKFSLARTNRLLVFIDTCQSAGFGGEPPQGARRLENNLMNFYSTKLFNEQGRAVLTAADVNEPSFENKCWGGGHGVFTYSLLEGLRGEADTNSDRLVTVGELFAYVCYRVPLETGGRQHPRLFYEPNHDQVLAFVRNQ